MKNNVIATLRRRIEKWELDHLRALAAELHEQLAQRERELDRANELLEFWQQTAQNLQEDMHDSGAVVGMTVNGHIGAIHPRAAA